MRNDPFFTQGLPQSDEAERSILGSIILEGELHVIDNRILDETVSLLPPESMHLDSHRRIYRSMIATREAELPVDMITVCDELRRRGDFDQIGGATYIASLIDGTPRTDTIAPYARLIRAAWHKRKLLNVSANIQAMVFDDELDAEGMQAAAEQYIYELAEADTSEGPKHVATVAAKLVDYYEAKAHDKSALIGLSTGYRDINARTLGLPTKTVTVIGARTSQGKTSLLTNIGTNGALDGKSVFMVSVESSAEQIVQRILASIARIDSYVMRQGRMNPDEWKRLEQALERLAVTQFVIDDQPDITPDMMISRGRRHKAKYGMDLLLMDHIHEMEPGKTYRSPQEKIGHVMTGLRRACRILDVPVLAAAQLSRAPDERPDHKPRLSDLAEASVIERVADLVLLLYRKWVYTQDDADQGLATLIFGKNRDGATDSDVHMAFFHQYTRFEDLAHDDWPQEEKRGSRRKYKAAYYGSRTDDSDD